MFATEELQLVRASRTFGVAGLYWPSALSFFRRNDSHAAFLLLHLLTPLLRFAVSEMSLTLPNCSALSLSQFYLLNAVFSFLVSLLMHPQSVVLIADERVAEELQRNLGFVAAMLLTNTEPCPRVLPFDLLHGICMAYSQGHLISEEEEEKKKDKARSKRNNSSFLRKDGLTIKKLATSRCHG